MSLPAAAQTTATHHFNQDGVSFEYPADFTLTDRSNPQSQHLMVTRPGTSVLIMVIAYRDALLTGDQFVAATGNTTEPYIHDLVEKLSTAKSPAKRDSACAAIGETTVGGIQVRGEINGTAATADVYAFPKGRRFTNLVYIRKDAEENVGDNAWKLIRESLNVDKLPAAAGAEPEIELLKGGIFAGGILNGRAISLTTPEYPPGARATHASGEVVVQVTIDETGKVIAAQALRGHPMLRPAAEEAARKARFTPTTLCGKPVKVNGIIVFNFRSL
jgi:TonB family protein